MCEVCDASGCYGKCPTSTRCSAIRCVRINPCPPGAIIQRPGCGCGCKLPAPERCPTGSRKMDDMHKYQIEAHYFGAYYAQLRPTKRIKNKKNQIICKQSPRYNDGKLSDLPWVIAKRKKDPCPVFVEPGKNHNKHRHDNCFKSAEMILFERWERENERRLRRMRRRGKVSEKKEEPVVVIKLTKTVIRRQQLMEKRKQYERRQQEKEKQQQEKLHQKQQQKQKEQPKKQKK